MKYSVNCCTKCNKNLTLTEDKFRMTLCTTCHYFMLIEVITINDYNKWLKQ